MKFLLFTIFLSLLTTPVVAQKLVTPSTYSWRVGEASTVDYAGALDPRINSISDRGQIDFYDSSLNDQYIRSIIDPEIFSLIDNWGNSIAPQSTCPNPAYAQNIAYIRYLYRLIGISYLQEALREYAVAAQQMGALAPACSLDWDKSFGRCAPKSSDMKTFIRRIKDRHLMGLDHSRMVRLSKAQTAQQLNLFNQRWLKNDMKGIVERRLSFLLPTNTPITLDQFAGFINRACEKDKQVVHHLCSEVDTYYGFAEVGLFTYLLQKSNALSVINDGGYGEACLRRFSLDHAGREDKLSYLAPLSEALFEQIRTSQLRYKQGSLFIAGALREFDDKGLEDFIFTVKKEEKPKITEEVKPIVVAMAPAPELIIEPEPAIMVEPEVISPEPVQLAVEKISQFELALKRMDESPSLEKASLDMQAFKQDFIFSPMMIQALKEPLHDFQTRQGLEDMAIGDKLGSAKEPVQLIFLKFLIDNNLHTGLFNVISVLGERFYVRNDIDGQNRPVLIELKNDESTSFRWQITLVRPSTIKAAGK